MNSRERAIDPLARLRFNLETMASAKKQHHRTDVVTWLYDAMWGPYVSSFIPGATNTPSLLPSLFQVQAKLPFNEPPVPGRSCGRIFQKGECCYRCKYAAYFSIILCQQF